MHYEVHCIYKVLINRSKLYTLKLETLIPFDIAVISKLYFFNLNYDHTATVMHAWQSCFFKYGFISTPRRPPQRKDLWSKDLSMSTQFAVSLCICFHVSQVHLPA